MRLGGGKIFDGQCVPPIACKVPQTPSYRLIAMVFVILRSRVVDEVDIACVGVCFKGCYEVAMDCIVVAVYPAYPPLISSCQCLRITASTCLLFVIIDHHYCRIYPHLALCEEVAYPRFLESPAHQCGAKAVDCVYRNLVHISQLFQASGSVRPPPKLQRLLAPLRVVTVGATAATSPIGICFIYH